MSQGEFSLRSQRGRGSFVLAPGSPEWRGCWQVRGASWGEAGLFYLQLPCVCPHSRLASARCFTSLFQSYPSFALWGPPNMAWAEAGRHRVLVMAWKSSTSRCFSLRPGGTDSPPQGHRVVVRAPTLTSILIPRQKGKTLLLDA